MLTASQQAIAAVRAIKNANTWGLDAALRYVEKRGAINHYFHALVFESKRRSHEQSRAA